MLDNQYLLIYDNMIEDGNLCSQYIYKEGKFIKVGRSSIKVAREKTVNAETADKKKTKTYKSKEDPGILYPRNDEQICAFDLAKDTDTTIKLLTGT